jgi:hypothetical protein
MSDPKVGSRGRQPCSGSWVILATSVDIRHAARCPSVFSLVSFQVWLWSQPMMVRAL